jgi:hypothetical protein
MGAHQKNERAVLNWQTALVFFEEVRFYGALRREHERYPRLTSPSFRLVKPQNQTIGFLRLLDCGENDVLRRDLEK